MTLLDSRLFSKSSVGELAKPTNQGGNISHKNTYDSRYTDSSKKENYSVQRNGRNDFDKEIESHRSNSKNSSSRDNDIENRKYSVENTHQEKPLKSSDGIKESQNNDKLAAAIEKLEKAASNKDSDGSTDIKLTDILTPEEITKLEKLGFGSLEKIAELLQGKLGDKINLDLPEKVKNKEALSILKSPSDKLLTKLSDISGIDKAELSQMLKSIAIEKNGVLINNSSAEMSGENTTSKTIKELLAMSGSINPDQRTKNIKSEKDNPAYLLNLTEKSEDGEKNSPFANMLQIGSGDKSIDQALEKFFSKHIDGINGVASKGSQSTQSNGISAQKADNINVFRDIRLDKVAGTTAKLTAALPSGDSTTARMHLNPRSLGMVFVEIHLTGKTADIKFRTESAEASKALEGKVQQLKDQLQKEGITAGTLEYTQDGQDRLAGDQNRQDSSREEMESRRKYIGQNSNQTIGQNDSSFGEQLTAENENSMTGRSS